MFRVALFAPLVVTGISLTTPAFGQSTVYIPAILELSGAGAVSGTNFRDGMLLAIDEINAKGGILGRKIETPLLDTQSDAGTSRAQVQKVLDNKPYVILGPVFSGSVLVDMMLTQQAEVPEIVGGEAAAITQKGNPYVFRTSFGQQFSMPKIANYMRDGVKAKTVSVLWVNNDFGKGGRDNFIKEWARATSRSFPIFQQNPGRPISRPTSSSSRRRMPMQSLFTSTRKKVRASCAKRGSKASTSR
jgi:branched-chain amino acid transport system substrate-binding protein